MFIYHCRRHSVTSVPPCTWAAAALAMAAYLIVSSLPAHGTELSLSKTKIDNVTEIQPRFKVTNDPLQNSSIPMPTLPAKPLRKLKPGGSFAAAAYTSWFRDSVKVTGSINIPVQVPSPSIVLVKTSWTGSPSAIRTEVIQSGRNIATGKSFASTSPREYLIDRKTAVGKPPSATSAIVKPLIDRKTAVGKPLSATSDRGDIIDRKTGIHKPVTTIASKSWAAIRVPARAGKITIRLSATGGSVKTELIVGIVPNSPGVK